MSWVGPAISAGGAILGGAMGGKGGSSGGPPKWVKKKGRELASFSKNLAKRPYEEYEGERVAPFSQDTLAAFDMVRNNVGAATPAYQTAMGASSALTGYQAPTVGDISASQWAGQSLDPYMNPYIQNVVDAQAADAQNAWGVANNQLKAEAGAANAFGNSRFGVVQGQALADNLRNQALISAQLRSQGFDTAAGLLGQDVDRQNWATGVNQQTALANQDADIRSAGMREAASRGLGFLAGQYQSSLGQDAAALGGVGSAQQALEQQQLDTNYGNYWDRTRVYPGQQVGLWSQGFGAAAGAQGATQPSGGGLMGALGGAQIGSQLGGSIYNWWNGMNQGAAPWSSYDIVDEMDKG